MPVTIPLASTGPSRRPATPAPDPEPATRRAAAGNGAAAAREQRDRRIVMGLIAVFTIGALVLMSFNVANSARETRARQAIGRTFVRMHSRQSEYRSLYGRFATWPELRARGVALGPRQSVVDSNADASHWFLSIRDLETGITCDRTGELMDAGATARRPVCRERKSD